MVMCPNHMMHPASDFSRASVTRLALKLHLLPRLKTTEACKNVLAYSRVSSAKEVIAVPTGKSNRDANLQTEPFMTNNLIVAPGDAPGAMSGVSSKPEESRPPIGRLRLPDLKTSKRFGRAVIRPGISWGERSSRGLLVLAWLSLAVATWGFGYQARVLDVPDRRVRSLLYCCLYGLQISPCPPQPLLPPHIAPPFLDDGYFSPPRRSGRAGSSQRPFRAADPGRLVARRGYRDPGLIRTDPAQSGTSRYRRAPACTGT